MNKYLQYQKPMAVVLAALVLPTLAGVYNFGWRALAVVLVCNLCCFGGEYLFTRKEGKPATLAALATGTLLALTLPPAIPFWMAAIGGIFAIIFGKMVYGGFGKNIFNPALVGRCFLYIAFPGAMASTWCGPAGGAAGGFAVWNSDAPVAAVAAPEGVKVDGVTGATTMAAVKKLDQRARGAAAVRTETESIPGAPSYAEAKAKAESEYDAIAASLDRIDYWNLFFGREAGCIGEGSALFILLGLAYLIYKKAAKWQLAVAPLVGMSATAVALRLAGVTVLPLQQVLLVNLFSGGTMFACAFMTTEPVSAPMNDKARWLYGLLIGVLAAVIRAMSAFNAGFMFAILLGNMFAPLLDLACNAWDARGRAEAKA